jgi:hypothetical protein
MSRGALTETAGFALVAVPALSHAEEHLPRKLDRAYEDRLLDLAASGDTDPNAWRAYGSPFFMGGLAVMLASARGFDRERYLRLAEAGAVPSHGAEAQAAGVKRLSGQGEYEKAFVAILSRVQDSLKRSPAGALPVRMYIAGGAALHLLTEARVSEDIDATFSARVLLDDDIQTSYRDTDGRARLMYLDRQLQRHPRTAARGRLLRFDARPCPGH